MSEYASTKTDSGSSWGWLAVAVLLAFVVWQSGVVGKWLNRPETVNQAWFDNYQDRYLSELTTVRVSSKANQRAYPTSQGTSAIGAYAQGTRIKGRWVRGADPKILWFKAGDGIYLWERNLDGDLQVIADARKAALNYGKGPDEASEAAIAARDAAAPAQASGRPTRAAVSPPPAPASTASAAPQQGFDAATAAAIRRAVGDPGLAGEIIANAEVVAPSDQQGATRLTWTMCASRCDYDFSSAVVLTGAGNRQQVQVCIHDSRRMAGQSDWYEPGKTTVRRPGLCPSALAGI